MGGFPRSLYTIFIVVLQIASSRGYAVLWESHGGSGLTNHRSAAGVTKINSKSVTQLELAWNFSTGFDMSATPSLADGAVYFPGWNGMLYALDAKDGTVIWARNLSQLIGNATLSRTTPVIYKHMLLLGLYGPAVILALHRFDNGRLLWRSLTLDDSPATVITVAGTIFEEHYYVGISSTQEVVASSCCSFQGSFVKLSVRDGHVVWRTLMLPPNSGFAGASIWGSSPSIDKVARLVFIATGNNYEVPDYVEECEKNRPNDTNARLRQQDPCQIEENRADSMLALCADTGKIVWSRQLEDYDVWTLPCAVNPNTPNCPAALGADNDFGEAPMLLHLDTHTCLAVAGQKNGVVWALDCYTGHIIWSTVAGPAGAIWGSCTDGMQVYTNIANSAQENFTLAPGTDVTRGGGWVAMDARTGKVIWSTANPSGKQAYGPVSVADGVVIVGSFAETGEVYALDAHSGSILWQSSTFASIYGGFSISSHCIFGGNGYVRYNELIGGNVGNSVFAFCLPCT